MKSLHLDSSYLLQAVQLSRSFQSRSWLFQQAIVVRQGDVGMHLSVPVSTIFTFHPKGGRISIGYPPRRVADVVMFSVSHLLLLSVSVSILFVCVCDFRWDTGPASTLRGIHVVHLCQPSLPGWKPRLASFKLLDLSPIRYWSVTLLPFLSLSLSLCLSLCIERGREQH